MKIAALICVGVLVLVLPFCAWSSWAGDLILEKPLTSGNYFTTGSLAARLNCRVPSGVTVSFEAYTGISLQANFRVAAGGSLRARVSDPDGLSNAWELLYFGNLDQGPDGDPDGDRLSNATELRLGTNPTLKKLDNDNDGLPDWWEVAFFGDLSQGANSDSDQDGYNNNTEFNVGTNPSDGSEAPVPAENLFTYDDFGRIVEKQVTLE